MAGAGKGGAVTIAVCVLIYLLVGLWSYFDAVRDIGWPPGPRHVFVACTVAAILLWPLAFVYGAISVIGELLNGGRHDD